MLFQANLKADSTTKPLLQRCQDLVKIIEEYPAKVLIAAFLILFIVMLFDIIIPTWWLTLKTFPDVGYLTFC